MAGQDITPSISLKIELRLGPTYHPLAQGGNDAVAPRSTALPFRCRSFRCRDQLGCENCNNGVDSTAKFQAPADDFFKCVKEELAGDRCLKSSLTTASLNHNFLYCSPPSPGVAREDGKKHKLCKNQGGKRSIGHETTQRDAPEGDAKRELAETSALFTPIHQTRCLRRQIETTSANKMPIYGAFNSTTTRCSWETTVCPMRLITSGVEAQENGGSDSNSTQSSGDGGLAKYDRKSEPDLLESFDFDAFLSVHEDYTSELGQQRFRTTLQNSSLETSSRSAEQDHSNSQSVCRKLESPSAIHSYSREKEAVQEREMLIDLLEKQNEKRRTMAGNRNVTKALADNQSGSVASQNFELRSKRSIAHPTNDTDPKRTRTVLEDTQMKIIHHQKMNWPVVTVRNKKHPVDAYRSTVHKDGLGRVHYKMQLMVNEQQDLKKQLLEREKKQARDPQRLEDAHQL